MSKTRLFKAARAWDLDGVREVLEAKPELVSVRNERGHTPLMVTAGVDPMRSGRPSRRGLKVAECMLDCGADVNESIEIADDYGVVGRYRALFFAVGRGRHQALVRLLLDRGSDPNGCLFAAGWNRDAAIARLLIERGSGVDDVAEGETPFLHCVKTRRPRMADLYLDRGADVSWIDPNGLTALHHALKRSFKLTEVKHLLERGADPRAHARGRPDAIEFARSRGRTRFAELMESYV